MEKITNDELHNLQLELFPSGYSGRGVKLTTHLRLLPKFKRSVVELFLHSPIRLDGLVLSYVQEQLYLTFTPRQCVK
jgi:hypothetical protein